MASTRSPHFQTPLALYSCLFARPKAIERARALARRRTERARQLDRYNTHLQRVIGKSSLTPAGKQMTTRAKMKITDPARGSATEGSLHTHAGVRMPRRSARAFRSLRRKCPGRARLRAG